DVSLCLPHRARFGARHPMQRPASSGCYPLSLRDALAILAVREALPETPLIASGGIRDGVDVAKATRLGANLVGQAAAVLPSAMRSEEHTSELQSRENLVCRLLLEKKNSP